MDQIIIGWTSPWAWDSVWLSRVGSKRTRGILGVAKVDLEAGIGEPAPVDDGEC